MMKLLLFEWKKMLKTKAFPVFLILTILFIFFLFIRNVIQQESIQAEKIEQFSKLAVDVYSQVSIFNDEVKRVGSSPELDEKIKTGLDLYSELKLLLEKIESNDWKGELESEINVYRNASRFLLFEGTRFNVPESQMERETKLNEELIQLNLPKQHLEWSIQTSIFMKKVVSILLSPLGFILLLLVNTSIITREFEDKNIQMVYALPVSRAMYMLNKMISLLITGWIWLIHIFGVSFLIPYFFGNNKGNLFQYPIYNDQGSFISSGDYLIQSFFYSFVFVAFAISLLLLVGSFIRNTTLTILSVFVLFIGGFLVTEYGFDFPANPFIYQTVDYAILNHTEYFPSSIFILLVMAVILLGLTLIGNRKRGI